MEKKCPTIPKVLYFHQGLNIRFSLSSSLPPPPFYFVRFYHLNHLPPKQPSSLPFSFLLLKNRLLQHGAIAQHNLLTRNHHDDDATDVGRPIDPLVIGAAADEEVARPHRLLLAAVQAQHDLARDDGDVVQAQRPVHGRAPAGRDVGGAEQDAAGWAAGQRLREVGRQRRVGHGHREARVEPRERAAVRPERREGRHRPVRSKDRRTVVGVARHHQAWRREWSRRARHFPFVGCGELERSLREREKLFW
jgi:hypothetical protein